MKQKKLSASDKKPKKKLKDCRQLQLLRSLGLLRKTPNASAKRLKRLRDFDWKLKP